MRILKLLGYALGFIAVLALAGWLYFQANDYFARRTEAKIEHLGGMAFRYVQLARQPVAATNGLNRATAKPVVVCLNKNDRINFGDARRLDGIDPVTAKLSSELFPKSTNEVRTVIGLTWGGQAVGKYSDGAIAYREVCQIRVVDLESGSLLSQTELLGGDPPKNKGRQSKGQQNSMWGSSCESEVIEYVEALFKK